ncbi:ChaN family lipoprotein [Aliiroseovarius sp. N1Y82]|nr:ChaN family lipoprotein [Aliiroseovarius subalbicans]MCI2399387.1 ChaN family lipoprotein [Aliiroseovarius subalbicans]
MKHVLIWLLMAGAALAASEEVPDVLIVGEVHDNPVHHDVQADFVARMQPAALVVEMLDSDQAGRITGILAGDPGAASELLGWNARGWPDFEMYRPIFTASPARIYGAAVPREVARAAYGGGIAAHFGDGAAAYGLEDALPEDELSQRLDLQFRAHCDAMPRDALGGMIAVQRLRDATLARAVVQALEEVGGPVVVITGNGHARRDWGVPSYLARVAPDVTVAVVGQGEDGEVPDGGFDLVLDAPSVDRPDPCEAFR